MHNGNHLVNCSHGWDRYRNWSRVVGDAPMVANSSEAGRRAPVTGASFDVQFRNARAMAARGEAFVWRLPSDVRDQKRHIVGLDEWQACGPRYKTRKDFVGSARCINQMVAARPRHQPDSLVNLRTGSAMDAGPSAAVVDLADRFRATLAGNFSTLHLRRSDALTHKAQKRKRCGTKVSTVKTYVDCVYPPPRCGPTRGTVPLNRALHAIDARLAPDRLVDVRTGAARARRTPSAATRSWSSRTSATSGTSTTCMARSRARAGTCVEINQCVRCSRVDGVEDDAMIQHERVVKF